jgi:prefoldin subunit 5
MTDATKISQMEESIQQLSQSMAAVQQSITKVDSLQESLNQITAMLTQQQQNANPETVQPEQDGLRE